MHHTEAIVKYLPFSRFKRAQRIKTVDSAIDDLKESRYVQEMFDVHSTRFVSSRLTEETFTAEELRDMLFGLCAVVKGDVESELILTTHTNVLLLRQVFRQAEKWHLKLSAEACAFK